MPNVDVSDPLRPEPSDYVPGPGWFSAKIGLVSVTFIDDIVDDARFEAFVEALRRGIDEVSEPYRGCVLYEVRKPALRSARRRKQFGAFLAARREKFARTVAAYAFATPSVFSRGTLKALFWIAPPPYETRVVATPWEGLSWFATKMPGMVNPGMTLRAYNGLKVQYIAQAASMPPEP
jgi:hypothetical protein